MICAEISSNSAAYFSFSFCCLFPDVCSSKIRFVSSERRTWICSRIVSYFWIFAFVDARLFSTSMILLLPRSIASVSSAILLCTSTSVSFALSSLSRLSLCSARITVCSFLSSASWLSRSLSSISMLCARWA